MKTMHLWPNKYSRNFSVNGYTLGRNDMAQVVGFLLEDQKFAQLSLQAFMLQSLQNNLLPSKVLCESGRKDNNIVQIQKRLAFLIAEDLLHKPLKSAWCIAQPEWHTIPLKEAEWREKKQF